MPELNETLEVLNKRLLNYYGKADDNRSIYRIVWANEQTEKRYGTYDDYSGDIYLRTVTEVRECPKYPYLKDLYVLEQLVIVPEQNARELGVKVSYEPLFSFQDKAGFPLPPKWEAAKWVIDVTKAAKNDGSMRAKYIDPLINQSPEERQMEIDKIKEALFGNESPVGDALSNKESTIIVPRNYGDN